MPAFHEQVHQALPQLTADNYRITSPATWEYNCMAWAVGATDAWWWPAPGRYWPLHAPCEETVAAFLAVFTALGYAPCFAADLEPDTEKIALYALENTPTHAARQLTTGWWTSKLGPSIDIEHETPDDVSGGVYGQVVALLSRRSVE
jgi:hypothetical protein